MRFDVIDGVGRDALRYFVGWPREARGVAHIEEPESRILREEALDIGGTAGHRGAPPFQLPLEGRHIRFAPRPRTSTESCRQEFTDQATPLGSEVLGVVDENSAFVDEEDLDGTHGGALSCDLVVT